MTIPVEASSLPIPDLKGVNVAIVKTTYHPHIINAMSDMCEMLIKKSSANVEVITVPGTYEIPLVAKMLAKKQKYEAIVVFGVILKGITEHYEVIRDTIIQQLGNINTEYEVPIIMEIQPVHDIKDAESRSQGALNKGIWAAKATFDMIPLIRSIKG